jgi:enoyl-[acyl-carrier protein] reductase II
MTGLRTRLCDVLGIDVPILQAGMAAYTNAELVAAVSGAGGLGILGGVSRTAAELADEADRVRSLTDRPWGINLVIADTPLDDPKWDACFAARPPLLSTSWGDVAPVMERARRAGCRVIHQVNTAAEAELAVRAGVDVIVAQGAEGGGHVGHVGTMALVPAVVDAAAGLPVIAAGGISDGRGVAAALALGADGVLLGTRFLATIEAPIPDGWKAALLASAGERAIVSAVPDLIWGVDWPGATCRVLRNRLIAEWDGNREAVLAQAEELGQAIETARESGEAEGLPLYAGQGTGLIREILPAAEVVRRLAVDALDVLRGRSLATSLA